jgi:nucleotide-binding universal stress UspA family protein
MGARIVVPLDGSESAEAILPYVWALLRRLRAEVVLVRAVDPPAR